VRTLLASARWLQRPPALGGSAGGCIRKVVRSSVLLFAVCPTGLRPLPSPGLPCAGHESWVLSVSAHPGGHAFATGSSDSKVKLWDLQTRTCAQVCVGGHLGGCS
jgi:WD40 repeat protein